MSDILEHYGTPRHSGRYPWGSGKNPQRNKNFLSRVDEYKAQNPGISEKELCNHFGLSTGKLRQLRGIEKERRIADNIRKCVTLKDKGYSIKAIGEATGLKETTIRSYLKPGKDAKVGDITTTANVLTEFLKSKPYLDVGEGVNRQLRVSEECLDSALEMCRQNGYNVFTFSIPQVSNPSQKTKVRVLTTSDHDYEDVRANQAQITSPDGLYFEDYDSIAAPPKPIVSVDSSRVYIRYAEDGGKDKDGVIEVRPGVEDLSLGGRNFAQARIAVDGDRYLKGMAVYGYDMPKGYDIVFNTNKTKDVPLKDVLKPMKDDPSNPFGATFTQWSYDGSDGERHVSPINIVNDEESYDKWAVTLSSQFLSKQAPALAKRQLGLAYLDKEQEFKDILSIPNETVRRNLLESFAEDCDTSAVMLKGAAMPRQNPRVILPITSLKDNEVYAPGYENGEEVILVRYPHAGYFETPRLIVNNNNKEGRTVIPKDARNVIGINSHVANVLSGADFDGDTVSVIPTVGQNLKSRSASTPQCLLDLKDFDPKEKYRKTSDMPKTGEKGEGFHKPRQMGDISNLITDMTIMGATPEEIARAVRHSMVVIDAENHNLDWRQSYLDNGIADLKTKYQSGPKSGAKTFIAQRKKEIRDAPERREARPYEMTAEELERWKSGENIYRNTGRTYRDKKTGKIIVAPNRETVYQTLETKDLKTLSSGYIIDDIYIDHATRMKVLGNQARKELRSTGLMKKNKEAEQTYKDEVLTLNAKINKAELNAPRERQAQLIANANIRAKLNANPDLKEDKDKYKKIKNQELRNAREKVWNGDKSYRIDITEKEWAAIQAGAISDTKLTQILRYADMERVRKLAAPKQRSTPSYIKARVKNLERAGYSKEEIAKTVGCSVNTVNDVLKSS